MVRFSVFIQEQLSYNGIFRGPIEHVHYIATMAMLEKTLHVNEFFHALNIGTPNSIEASAGVRNDLGTHVGVKIDPKNPFT